MKRLQPYPVAVALSFVFMVLYLVCVMLHYFLPKSNWQMYHLWEMILPGFTWLTTTSLLVGILLIFIGGFYVAYILVPLFNYFDTKYLNQKGEKIMKPLHFKPVVLAVTIFAVITYILCIVFDLIFPQWAMTEIWKILLPGFTGLNWRSFLIGLLGIIGYGVYIASVFVPIYNFFRSDRLPELK